MGMTMKSLILMVVPPLLILGLAIFLLWVPLPSIAARPWSHDRNLPVAIFTGLIFLCYSVAFIWYMVATFLRAGNYLDPVMVSLGFSGRGNLFVGRSYHGRIFGREVTVETAPGHTIRRPLIQVYAAASTGTRLAAGARTPLLDSSNCPVLSIGIPELEGIEIRAQDEQAARRLIEDAGIRRLVLVLAGGDEQSGFRELYIQPERVWVRVHPARLDGAEIRSWMTAATELAIMMERKS